MTVFILPGVPSPSLPRIGWRALSGTVSGPVSAAGYEPARAVSQQTQDGWKPSNLNDTRLWDMTFDTPQTVNYCAIGAHDLGSLNCTIRFVTNNGTEWVRLSPDFAVTKDTAIMLLFPSMDVSGVRVSIISGDAPPTLGHIRWGRALAMPRPAQYTGDPIDEGQQITLRQNVSETGEFLGGVVEGNGLQFSVSVQHLSEAFRQGEWREFRNWAERGNSFFVATKPVQYPEEVAYAWLSGRANMTRDIPNKNISGSVEFSCVGYAKP